MNVQCFRLAHGETRGITIRVAQLAPRLLRIEEWNIQGTPMAKFLLWLILLVICWPLALLALILYPFIWLILLPFRVVGITVEALFDLVKVLLTLPARMVRGM